MNVTNIIRTDHLKRLSAALLFVMLAFSVAAQEKGDSIFTFRFFVGKNQFYAPGLNNGPELTRMYSLVDQCKDLIKDHKLMVYVNGYSNANINQFRNLAIAKIRSNRVKSELITNKGLKEDNFITKNHAGEGDFVTVRFAVPKEYLQNPPQESRAQEPPPEPEPQPEPQPVVPPIAYDSIEIEDTSVTLPDDTISHIPVVLPDSVLIREDSPFALKTNLLDYAILMPNLEVEWNFMSHWSLALEGQIAWWAKKNPHKVYRVATIIPEVRYWPIEHKRWHGMYVGLFGGVGMYDLHNGKSNGHEGEGYMIGVSAGYMWPISSHLSMEAGLGVGYLGLRDKVYRPLDNHFLYQFTKNINYFGPLRLKLSLVWRIPK